MKKKSEQLRGEKLLKTAINQILEHPETWYQGSWHSACGTKHCIAGHCQILSGKPMSGNARIDAKEALGISDEDAHWLFRPNCSLGEMYHFAKNFNRDGFNRDGFNRDGFDRDGFNRDGFDRDGFNRDGKKLTPFEL